MEMDVTEYRRRKLLTILLVIALCFLFFVIGMIIGYSKIGKGSWLDVFHWQTWHHIFSYFRT